MCTLMLHKYKLKYFEVNLFHFLRKTIYLHTSSHPLTPASAHVQDKLLGLLILDMAKDVHVLNIVNIGYVS